MFRPLPHKLVAALTGRPQRHYCHDRYLVPTIKTRWVRLEPPFGLTFGVLGRNAVRFGFDTFWSKGRPVKVRVRTHYDGSYTRTIWVGRFQVTVFGGRHAA